MSRLIDPGPGEILDRLTILALKVVYGRLKGVACGMWEQERDALLQLYKVKSPSPLMAEHYLELGAVNGALWQAEDDIRRYRTEGVQHRDGVTFHAEVGRCAMQIQTLNDRRAELITLININTGVERPSDKV